MAACADIATWPSSSTRAWPKARGRGRLDARGLGTAITARFDLPAAWPLPNRQTPLHLQLDLAETDLAALTKAIDAAVGPSPASGADRMRGRVRLSARLDGTPDRPRLTVDGRRRAASRSAIKTSVTSA